MDGEDRSTSWVLMQTQKDTSVYTSPSLPCISIHHRPEILKQEIKVFFVKYNDPIYVKLEKLDIMIRLASQANIAQVRLKVDSSEDLVT